MATALLATNEGEPAGPLTKSGDAGVLPVPIATFPPFGLSAKAKTFERSLRRVVCSHVAPFEKIPKSSVASPQEIRAIPLV